MLFNDAHIVDTLCETFSKKRLREEEAIAARFFKAKELSDCVYEQRRYYDADAKEEEEKSDARLRKELDLHNAMEWIHVDPQLRDIAFTIGGRFAPPLKYQRVAVHADFVMMTTMRRDKNDAALPPDFVQISDCTALTDLDERYPHLKAKCVFVNELNAAPVLYGAVMRALGSGRRGVPIVERAAMTLAKVAQGLRQAALALAHELDLEAILLADAARDDDPELVFARCIARVEDTDVSFFEGRCRASEMRAALHEGRTQEAVLQALAAARAVDCAAHALWFWIK